MDKCEYSYQLQVVAGACRGGEGKEEGGAAQADRSTKVAFSLPLLRLPFLTPSPPCNNLDRRQLKLAPAAACSSSSACGRKPGAAESLVIAGCCSGSCGWSWLNGGLQLLQMPPREDLNLPEEGPPESGRAGAGAETPPEGTEQEVSWNKCVRGIVYSGCC